MPLVKMEVLRQAAHNLAPYLLAEKEAHGCITDDGFRRAVRAARRDGVSVGQLRSARSATIIDRLQMGEDLQ
jgi:hypothetical protein